MSQTPSPPSRTYGPKSFLMMAAVCLAFGCAYYVLARQVLKQSKVTDTMRSETQEVRTELEGYRKDTAPLPLAQEELKKKIAQIEEAHRAMTEQLRVLRLTATGEQIEHDRRVAHVAELRRMAADTRQTLQTLKDELAAWKKELASLMTDDLGKQLGAEPRAWRLSQTCSTRDRYLTLRSPLGRNSSKSVCDRFRANNPQPTRNSLFRTKPCPRYASCRLPCRPPCRMCSSSVRGSAICWPQHARHHPAQQHPNCVRRSKPIASNSLPNVTLRSWRRSNGLSRNTRASLPTESAQTKTRLGEAGLEKERKLRELSEQLLRSNTEIEAQKMTDAIAEVRRQELERQTRLKGQIEEKQKEAKFEAALPEINKFLVPFITPGHKQLDGSRWIYSDEAKPLSLAGLRATHGLDNNQEGYQRLYFVAGSIQNDRPDGPFRVYNGGALPDADVPLIRKAQILLEDFGDIMVEKGMLLR